MFQEGDYIVYRNTGVCRVEKIGIPEGFPAGAEDVQYYHLTPVYGSGTIYIPVTSNVFMRAIITKEEALSLIASIPSIEENPDYSKDYKTLADHYQALLDTHDCYALVQLIKNIYCKNQELLEKGKGSKKTDQHYRKQAETLLHEELSVALNIPLDEVPAFIQKQLETA